MVCDKVREHELKLKKKRQPAKAFYIYAGSKTDYSGVKKKIHGQCHVFSKYVDIEIIPIEKDETNLIKSISWRLPFGSWGANYGKTLQTIERKAEDRKVEFIYIRHRSLDRKYVSFLKKIRQTYPDTKVVLEIATFPYDHELLHDKEMWPWFFKDRLYRHKVKYYVDRIVTFSDDESIFGIPTIQIMNGINLDDLPISDAPDAGRDSNAIHLLAVAQFQKTHGYERVIRGLAAYYADAPERKVYLNMVGEGKEKHYYEELVKINKLQNVVLFHGKKEKDELVSFYKEADIALGVFGGYKRRLKASSSLKIREYLAYGIPIVSGMKEDVLSGTDCGFYLEFPNDSTDVPIKEIVRYYDKLYQTKTRAEISKEIKEYAKENVDMHVTMRPVIQYLMNESSRS